MEEKKSNEKDLERARKRAHELREFYNHLWSYIGVNAILIIINLITSPKKLWFYWITAFWGIAIISHAIRTFGKNRFDEEWEEQKAKEILKKKK